MSNNNDINKFEQEFLAKSGTLYTLAWEDIHESSLRVTFVGNNYYFPETEDSRDPTILKISSLIEGFGFTLVMDHSIKGNGIVNYSLRFKKDSGKETRCSELLNIGRILAEKA